MIILYGIKNCDTVKKARTWLDQHNISYRFHDFRSDGLDNELLTQLEQQAGWENLLNKRSTSWRQLTEQQKDNIDKSTALQLMQDIPTLIKRPVLKIDTGLLIGFKAETYQNTLL